MKHFTTLLFLIFCFNFYAQKSKDRKITIDDLEQTHHQIDTSAAATILHKKSQVKFKYDIKNGFQLIQEVEYIYKIYKKDGLKYADIEIPYYVGYKEINQDRVSIKEAETYNLVNGKILKTQIKDESIHKTKLNEFWHVLKISFPNVKEGSIFKYKYEFKSEDIGELPDFNFQYDIPVDYVELKTFVPEFYIYKTIQTGLLTINLDSKMSNGFQNFDDKYGRGASFSFKQIDNFFYLENVPALKIEPYIDNLENYRITLFHELEVIRMPDQDVKKVSMSWADVGLSLKKDDVFKAVFDIKKYFENHCSAILKDQISKEEKMNKLFRNIQSLTQWNGKYGIYKLKSPDEVFNSRTGNISEINGLLIKMLRENEINAYPLLISTLNNGVAVFPTNRKFNAFITAVDIDGKIYLMDASDKLSSIGVLPTRNLNWNGQIVKHDYQLQQIELAPKAKSTRQLNLQYELKNNQVNGKLRNSFTNHQAYKFLIDNDKSSNQSNLERLDNQYELFEVENLIIDQSEKDNKYMVTESFDFKSNNAVDVIANKTMLSPFLGLANFLNPFTHEDRKLPIYFGYPQQLRFQSNIKIDETMTVEHLPESISIKIEGDLLSFTYRLTQSQDSINANIVFDINKPIYNAMNYDEIKEFFNKVTAKLQEKIILVKK
jgi:hypothetical protein